MKKLVASVGLMALGASGLQAAPAGLIQDPAKPWSVGITLRGFYDDNVAATRIEDDSLGFEVNPFAGYTFNLERGSIVLGYNFSYKWYEDPAKIRDANGNVVDELPDNTKTHNFDFALEHSFGTRYDLAVHDSFVIGQEPDILRSENTFNTFSPVFGDNIRNYGSINLNVRLTRLFSLGLGYVNSFFDYDDETISASLDRIEHMPHIDGRWQLQPNTVGILGYQYRLINYTADDPITATLDSDARNSRMHYIYVGAEHSFRPDLFGAFKAGASFIDYYNDPNSDNDVAPYVSANLRYTYLPESNFELGASYDRNSTDVLQNTTDSDEQIVQDAQTFAIWAALHHRITPKLYGHLTGQVQNSMYQGNGSFDGDSDWFYTFGANLEYRFNAYFAAHVGYNFDSLDGDTGRDFDRNRVYIGVTAGY